MAFSLSKLRYVTALNVTLESKIEKVAEMHKSQSLSNGSKKQRSKFALLSKKEKREWRESIQRLQSAIKSRSRQLIRAMDGKKIRGKALIKVARANERAMKAFYNDQGIGPQLQAGTEFVVGATAGAAAAMTATAYSLTKQVNSIGNRMSDAIATVKETTNRVGSDVRVAVDELKTVTARIGNNVNGLVDDVRLVANSIQRSADVTANTAASANSMVDDLREAFHGFVAQLSSVGSVLKRVACAIFVWWVCETFNAPMIVSVMLGLLGAVVPDVVQAVTNLITKPKLQDGYEDLSAVVAMFLTCWMPNARNMGDVTSEFMKRVSNFPRAKDGISKFMEGALDLFERLVNFVLRAADEDVRVKFIERNDLFVKWCAKSNEYRKYLAENAEVNITKLLEIREHYLFGFGLYEHLHSRELQEKWKYMSGQLGMALEPHQGAMNASHNLRAMPVWAQFGGASGVGKTSLIKSVASIVLWLSGEVEPKEALANIWQKGTTEYWNGYVGQKCLVIDDAFQVKPKPGDPDSEAMQAIRAVGNFACPLNFADVVSKGKFHLNTPLIVSTTNAANVQAEWEGFITCPAALVRRIQYGYWVKVAKGWETPYGRLDYEKFQEYTEEHVARLLKKVQEGQVIGVDDIIDVVPWHAWDIYPHGYDNSQITTHKYEPGMRQVVLDMAEDMHKRRKSHEREMKTFDDWTTIMSKAKFDIKLQDGTDEEYKSLVEGLKPSTSVIDIPVSNEAYEKMLKSLRFNFADYQPVPSMADEISPMEFEPAVSHMQKFREKCMKLKDVLMEWVSSWTSRSALLKTALVSAGVVGVLALGFKLVKSIVSGSSSLFETLMKFVGIRPTKKEMQSGEGSVKPTVSNTTFHVPSIGKARYRSGATLQVGVPPQEGAYDKIYDNVYKVHLVEPGDDKEGVVLGHFICVGTHVFVFNKHFIQALENVVSGTKMRFYHATSNLKLDMLVDHFLEMEIVMHDTHDLAAVAMDLAGLKSSKNIVNLFLKESEIKSLLRSTNVPCRLDLCDIKRRKEKIERAKCTHYTSHVEYLDELECNRNTKLVGLVKYKLATKAGDCGGLLSVVENRHYGGRCIIGLHSAGHAKVFTREGYATLLTQEAVLSLFCELSAYRDRMDYHRVSNHKEWLDGADVEPEVVMSTDLELEKPTDAELAKLQDSGLVGGSMIYLGQLKKSVNIANVTALIPSPVQEEALFGPSPSLPAHLKPVKVEDGVKYPMVEGTRAYQSDLLYDSTRSLDPVVEVAMLKHKEATEGAWRGILTLEEAVVPPESLKLKRINPNTSPGYKYREYVTPKNPGKRYFLGHDDNWIETFMFRPEFDVVRKDVCQIISDAEVGVRRTHLCVDFLKDELRPLRKVENVMTRVISGTEFDYCLAVRMYFGAFIAATFASRIQNGMSPGINHYTEWGELAAAMLDKGRTKMFDGDFKRFDASEQPWITNAILKYIQEWYKASPCWRPQHDVIRRVLWLDLIHSRHVVGLGSQLNHVVQWNKSLPSGHPLTTIVNSMYSLITIVGCYHLTTSRLDFWDECFCNTFGDDNITAVSDEVAEKFNQVTTAEAMKAFGLEYTSGSKDGQLRPYTDIEQITFLKRKFVRDDDPDEALIRPKARFGVRLNVRNYAWVGPLDPNSFLYEPYWFKNKKDMWGDVARRIEHALCEMALHDREFWDSHAPKYLDYARANGLKIPFVTREQAREHVKTRFDVWF